MEFVDISAGIEIKQILASKNYLETICSKNRFVVCNLIPNNYNNNYNSNNRNAILPFFTSNSNMPGPVVR